MSSSSAALQTRAVRVRVSRDRGGAAIEGAISLDGGAARASRTLHLAADDGGRRASFTGISRPGVDDVDLFLGRGRL